MAQVNNVMKFFQFLADTCGIKSKDEMLEAMDENKDGHIVKSELKEYVKNWDGNFTDTELNQFWKAVDTQTKGKIDTTNGTLKELNALDANEMENMGTLLKAYSVVNALVDSQLNKIYIDLPGDVKNLVDYSQLKASVSESIGNDLSSFVKKNAAAADFETQLGEKLDNLLPKAMGKTIANIYSHAKLADAVKSEISLNQLGYKGGDDFEALINNFIATIGKTAFDEDGEEVPFVLEDMITNIQSLVKDFVASAVGDGKVSKESILFQYGYNGNKLNSLQAAVVKDSITKSLKDEVEGFKAAGLEADFNKAVENFIQSKIDAGLSENVTFVSLKNLDGAEFRESKEYKALEIRKDLGNIKAEGEQGYNASSLAGKLYQKIKDDCGEDVAKSIAENDVYNIGSYKQIINAVAAKIANGDVEPDKALDEIVNNIITNLSAFVSAKDMSVTDLYKAYTTRFSVLETIKESKPEEALAQHRQAAINYCDALIAMDSELKDLINEKFNNATDYKTAINGLWPKDIKDIIDKIKDEVATMLDTDGKIKSSYSLVGDWKTNVPTHMLKGQDAVKCSISAQVKDKKGNLVTEGVTYKLVKNPGTTVVTEFNASTGEFTLNPLEGGSHTIEVGVYVNGKQVATKSVTVNISGVDLAELNSTLDPDVWSPNTAQPTVEKLMAKYPDYFAGRSGKDCDGSKVSDKDDVGQHSTVGHVISFEDGIDGKGSKDGSNLNTYQENLLKHINKAIEAYKTYFIELGVDTTFLNSAINSLNEYYKNIVNSFPTLTNRSRTSGDGTIITDTTKYTDPATGETKTANTAYTINVGAWHNVNDFHNDMMDNWKQNTSGLYLGVQKDSDEKDVDVHVWVDYRLVFVNLQKLLSGAGL